MSDPLSIAASIAGLITISAQIVGIAKELFDKVKDAPETMMRVREEVEGMEPIFHQVQLLLNGSGSGLNRGNLTMISIHNLMATLTGCVIVYSRLEKKVNEVCGFSDPTSSWKRAGVVAGRVKWGLWRHEEVLVIIEELQRHKLSLNMMLTILSCTTTTEAAENQARLLQEQTTELLQSNNAQSVLLRELIGRQQEQARTLEIILAGSARSTRPSTAGSHPSDHRGSSDNASIMSKRSTLSFRLGRPDYLEDLKESRAYKRLRHFGRGIDIDSSAESVFSSDSGGSTGNWSMLSDITLGDLSVSQIAVLNLPIELSDVSNPEPFLEPGSAETRRNSRPRSRRIWSSRGRIHNAIENGNEFVVRTVLGMGMDIEELDSNGRTPLLHAIEKHQVAICNILLDKGASVEPLKAFTTGMDPKERSKLLDTLITSALDDGESSTYVTVLRLFVQMALGTNYGDDNQSSGQSMMNAAIDMGYVLAVRAVIHLEPRVLVEIDAEGRTPLIYAIMKQQEAICKLLLQRGASVDPLKAFTTGMDLTERSELLNPLITRALDGKSSAYVAVLRLVVQMALGTNYGDDNQSSGRSMMNAAIDIGYDLAVRAVIHLEPQVLVEVDTEGRTPFAYAYHLQRNEICEMLLQGSKVDTEIATEVVKSEGNIAERVHAVIEEKFLLLLRLQLLLATSVDVDKIDAEGQTPLAHATEVVLNSDDINYGAWNDIFKALLNKASSANVKTVKNIRPKPGAPQSITTSMHGIVRKDYKSILQLLSLIESRDAEGWTPLASAAFNLNEALCRFLVEKGCSLCLDTEQKNQLKPKLSCRIIDAARDGHETALQLLLDMGADINEKNSVGETALLEAVFYNHLSCVKILLERGADATVLTNSGYSVLHYAAWGPSDSEMMKFLLDNIVETRNLVDMKSSEGNTALYDCSYSGGLKGLENAKMLLQAGASLTIKNRNGRTPYEYARVRGRKELAKYLWSQLSPEQQAQEEPSLSDW